MKKKWCWSVHNEKHFILNSSLTFAFTSSLLVTFVYQRTDVYPFTARGLRSLDVKMKVVWDTIYKLKCFSALERWYPIVMLMTQIMFAFSNLFHNIINFG